MIIGVLKEVKDNESRVAMTPEGVKKFIRADHRVLIDNNAGIGSGISNEQYKEAGAEILENKNEICKKSELILKIKEPVPAEYNIFSPGQMLFTFFHFASNRQLTEAMINAKVTCIAYETVETADGEVPLLAPMSEIAGKMAPIVAANYLAKPAGGKGVLASSVGNVKPARFVILGGGNAGQAAATVALGMGADVTIIEKTQARIEELKKIFTGASFALATPENVATNVKQADVVIGTVHVPGARAPKLVSGEMVKKMEEGSVIVDIAIDQGGSIETSRPTTHSNPVYVEEGVIHYCVTNMPGVFPRTSTFALTSTTISYALELADKGTKAFENSELLKGLNIYKGKITNKGVAEAHNLPYTDPKQLLE
jgi:alanine dehydrogenase